jgi:isoquinoline 1-oxidoreductase alpha subunit
MRLNINGKTVHLDVEPDMPLLWALRDHLGLTGTKFGCGMGLCGACTVHLDGQPTRACQLRTADAAGKAVTTIEGLSRDGSHPVQLAWRAARVPQCGYCQSGQIMTAAALVRDNPRLDGAQIRAGMAGHICRCGTYGRIERAVALAASMATEAKPGGKP